MDRFDEIIRKYYGDYQGFPPVVDALRDAAKRMVANRDAEIERLRKIEDAAIASKVIADDDDHTPEQYGQALAYLDAAIEANPRPESDDG